MKRPSRRDNFPGAAAIVIAVTVALGGGCSNTVRTPEEQTVAATRNVETPAPVARDELRKADLGDAAPVHAVGNLYLAGQPNKDEFEALAKRGIKTIVTLCKPDEIDWDERAAVEAAGMEFVAVPFNGAEELTDNVFERVRKILNERGDDPAVLHCGRANRVGAVWMVHRVLDEGVGIETALEEAKTVGLRTPEYAAKAEDYIRRVQRNDGDRF